MINIYTKKKKYGCGKGETHAPISILKCTLRQNEGGTSTVYLLNIIKL